MSNSPSEFTLRHYTSSSSSTSLVTTCTTPNPTHPTTPTLALQSLSLSPSPSTTSLSLSQKSTSLNREWSLGGGAGVMTGLDRWAGDTWQVVTVGVKVPVKGDSQSLGQWGMGAGATGHVAWALREVGGILVCGVCMCHDSRPMALVSR